MGVKAIDCVDTAGPQGMLKQDTLYNAMHDISFVLKIYIN